MKGLGETLKEQSEASFGAWWLDAAHFPVRIVWPVLKEKFLAPMVFLAVSMLLLTGYPVTVTFLAWLRRRAARKEYARMLVETAPSFEVGWSNGTESGGVIIKGVEMANAHAVMLMNARKENIFVRIVKTSETQ